MYVVIRNLDVRTYDIPGISGIDLHHAMQCRIENVFINTGVYNEQASQPTHGTKGLVTPANSNTALTILRNVTVTGYGMGIVVNEQTDAHNAWQQTVHDVNDPANLGTGDITYWVVIRNVGAVDTFSKNGGGGLRARRVGVAP